MTTFDTTVAPASEGPLHRLTARERDVLALVAAGHSNVGIARELGTTVRTIETHTSRIFLKLELDTDQSVHRRVLAAVLHLRAAAG